MPAKLHWIVPSVPPSMDDACRKRRSPPCGHNKLFSSQLDSKRSRLYPPFLPLSEMHMRRRPIHVRRQRAIERQYDLSLGVALSAHPQNFSGMSVLQPQKIIHDSSSILEADNLWRRRSPTPLRRRRPPTRFAGRRLRQRLYPSPTVWRGKYTDAIAANLKQDSRLGRRKDCAKTALRLGLLGESHYSPVGHAPTLIARGPRPCAGLREWARAGQDTSDRRSSPSRRRGRGRRRRPG